MNPTPPPPSPAAPDPEMTCTVHRDLPYAKHGERTLPMDLYIPKADSGGRAWPVLLWFPGGGWRNCRKESVSWAMTDRGFAVASIDYRVSGEAAGPANVHDCKAAVRFLRAHASQYELDAHRIGAWGASAGGHLAALVTLTEGIPELEGIAGWPQFESSVAAGCDLCGPSDLAYVDRPEIHARFGNLHEVTVAYLGGSHADKAEKVRLLSPITYARAEAPPLMIIHGEDDATVSVQESIRLHEALAAEGARSILHVLPGVGHSIPRDDALLDRIAQFFRQAMGG